MNLLCKPGPLCFMLALLAAPAVGQQRQLLLTTGESLAADITYVDATRSQFQSDAGEQELLLDKIVRYGSLAPREARPTVLLWDGSQVVAAPVWSRRGSVQLVDDQWQVVNNTLRDIRLPRDAVRAVWFAAAGENAIDEPFRRASALHAGREDRVWLTSGDELAGIVLAIQNRSLSFQAAGEQVEIELARVKALALAGETPDINPKMAIGLADGSLLYAQALKLVDDSLAVKLTDGQFIAGRPKSALCFMQPFGQRVTYLSDLTPIDYRQTSYLGVAWHLAVDQSLAGEALEAGELRLLKGLAMHSAARAVYRLDGEYSRFESLLAIDNSAGTAAPGGSVVYKVYVARQQGFEPAYESPIVRGGDAPLPVSVDIKGATAIALLVEYAEHGDQQDHADWLEARLVK